MYEPWIAVLLGQRDALQVLAMLEAYIVYLGMRDGWFGRANVIWNFGLEKQLLISKLRLRLGFGCTYSCSLTRSGAKSYTYSIHGLRLS